MSLKKEYPDLFQFLAGYFPDADFDNLSDSEVVSNYISDCRRSRKSEMELENTKKDLSNLLFKVEVYWKEVGQEANRHFDNWQETLEWLQQLRSELEKQG